MNADYPAVAGTAPDSGEPDLELPSGDEAELGDDACSETLKDYNEQDENEAQLPSQTVLEQQV